MVKMQKKKEYALIVVTSFDLICVCVSTIFSTLYIDFVLDILTFFPQNV